MPLTRSQAFVSMVNREVARRRVLLDADDAVSAVIVTVKFDPTGVVRGVTWHEETDERFRRPPDARLSTSS